MTKETFNKALTIREIIHRLELMKNEIHKMENRPDDSQFCRLKSISYDLASEYIEVLEEKFKAL